MKASIDELTEKLLRQIKDERDKRTSRRKTVDKHAVNGTEPRDLAP
jgi:ribosome-associated translation inhibitor RaiA